MTTGANYDPSEWKDPGNLPAGQEWCEDCGEGHSTKEVKDDDWS